MQDKLVEALSGASADAGSIPAASIFRLNSGIRPFETKQEVQQHVAQLREDVTRSESGRLIEGPTAFWDGKKNFAGFYVSYRGRGPSGDKLVRQVAQLYFGGRLYRFSCQFVPSHGPAMDGGCKHALETLEIEGLDEIPQ